MPRSVSRRSSHANKVSISSGSAEHNRMLVSSDYAEQPCSAVCAVRREQNRQVTSPEPQVVNEFSIDADIPEIDRPSRMEGDSPTSVYVSDCSEGPSIISK